MLKFKRFYHANRIFFGLLAFCILSGSFCIYHIQDFYRQQIEMNAITLAETASAFIPPELLAELDADADDIGSPAYHIIKEKLVTFKEKNESIKFAYLLTLVDRELRIMADSEPPESKQYSPPGQVFYEASAQYLVPYQTGQVHLTPPVSDRWGNWISVLVPIRDPDSGRIIAEFGIDFPRSEWYAEIYTPALLVGIVVICVLLLLVAIFLISKKNRTLGLLTHELEERELLFRTVFEQAPIGIIIGRDHDCFSESNTEFARILGRSKEELTFIGWTDLMDPKDLKENIELANRFMSGDIDRFMMEKRLTRPNGTCVWVNMLIARLSFNIGQLQRKKDYICIIQDINERKQSEENLRESERSKSVLLSNIPGMAYRCLYDREWTMKFLSDGCSELTGYQPERLINNRDLSFNEMIVPEFRTAVWLEWECAILKGSTFRYEYEIITASGEHKWVMEIGQAVFDADCQIEALEGIIIDISESKRRISQIEYMNDHDYLTGLYNRKYFEEQKIRLSHLKNHPVSIIIADINGVRLVNDAFGQQEGDRIISDTARILRSCCRPDDILARTGGDEFSLLLPGSNRQAANDMMHVIKAACEAHSISIAGHSGHINLSIGYGTLETGNGSIHMAEKEAEEYMHKRKLFESKSYHSSVLSSIMATMFARSQETEEHAERIASLCMMIGTSLNLPQKNLDDLHLFAILHDLGKIGIDDRILNKPGQLDEEERRMMKRHPEIGFRIAASTPALESIASYILSHHEHWDGSGYPYGQAGESIPLLSRILAVADAYDAMTENRVYRKALPREFAIQEIRNKAGTQFDPQIARVFIDCISEQKPLY